MKRASGPALSLLIVTASPAEQLRIAHLFERDGITIRPAASTSEARIALAEHAPDVTILSHPFTETTPADAAAALLHDEPALEIIILTEPDAHAFAEQATQLGALCLSNTAGDDAVIALAYRAGERARTRAELALRRTAPLHADPVVPPAPELDMLIELAIRNDDEPVLIVGEHGTGKSSLARLVHNESSRGSASYFEMQCTTNARSHVERTLFGHERGAATDAGTSSRGLVELASDGSVLLRSISSLPFETQSVLLRFVEKGLFRRTAGVVDLASSARIMASTTRPLAPAVDAGLFRSDLFYRLQVLTIAIPPLRARAAEIERLIPALLPHGTTISPAALLALQEHSWPGNMRELQNVVWRAGILAGRGRIEVHHLPLTAALGVPQGNADTADQARPAPLVLADLERRTILAALERTGGNKLRAAALLGIARSTLHDKLKRI